MRGLLRYAADAVRSGIEGGKQAKADKLKLGILAQDRGRKEQDRQRDIEEDMLRKSILDFNFKGAQTDRTARDAAATQEAASLAALQGQDVGFKNLSREAIERQLGERAKPQKPETSRPITLSPGAVAVDPTTGKVVARGNPTPEHEPTLAERESRAAAKQAVESAAEMKRLFDENPENAVTPRMSAGIRGMGNAPLVGGLVKGFTEGTANNMLSGKQQQFQKAADRLLHNIGSVLPKGGRSVAILQNLRQSFVPSAGETDPATVARTVQAAQEVAALYNRMINGENIDLESELERVAEGSGKQGRLPGDAARALVGRVK